MSALSNLLRTNSRRLRAIEGPLQGTIHPLGERFRIGRSGMADLQLLDERVSREHAEIVAGPDGSHWIIDQGSSNGTIVDGKPVRRAELRLDSIFRIEGSSFVFEEEVPPVGDADETFVVSYHGAPSRCGTMEIAPAAVEAIETKIGPDAGPDANTQTSTAIPAATECDQHHRVKAMYYNGVPYMGNVLEDIALYRKLELKIARNEIHSTAELDRFEKLSTRLCLPQKAGEHGGDRPRLYARLSCCLPATLRLASGERLSVAMVDLGVDGAQVLIYGHSIVNHEVAWLTIDLTTGGRVRTLVFTSEVTWTSANHIGLSFSGRREWRNSSETQSPYPEPARPSADAWASTRLSR